LVERGSESLVEDGDDGVVIFGEVVEDDGVREALLGGGSSSGDFDDVEEVGSLVGDMGELDVLLDGSGLKRRGVKRIGRLAGATKVCRVEGTRSQIQTHDTSSIVLDGSKKLGVGSSLENEIPDHLVTRLDLFSTGGKRSVGRKAKEVDVLESGSRVLFDEGLDVPLDETSEVEVGDVVSGGWG